MAPSIAILAEPAACPLCLHGAAYSATQTAATVVEHITTSAEQNGRPRATIVR